MSDLIQQPIEIIASRILIIRGQRIMIDADLAELYGVQTKRLNEQVKRNPTRFPGDFMFQLSEHEKAEVVANCDHLNKLKFSKSLPFAFTEHGAIQAANVLNSERADQVSIFVVRAFIKLRELLATHKDLAAKMEKIERKIDTHDQAITGIINVINQLTSPEAAPQKRPIGFVHQDK
jgi:hypothetical protein